MDAELAAYLAEVVERLEGLEAVWLIGSAATGAYVPGRSDVDVIGIATAPLTEQEREALATDLSHERLPCPARKLELAIYTRASVERPAAGLQPELNLNTGRGEHSVEPAESFWFVIDLAQAREQGRTLRGPQPAEVLGELPRPMVLDALRASLDWHAREEPGSVNAALNAYRALRYAEDGSWSTKPEAERWGRRRLPGVTPENAVEKVRQILEI